MYIRTEVFFGTKVETAADKVNQWLEEHPGVEILEFRYQHTTSYWHHSICILYRERGEE